MLLSLVVGVELSRVVSCLDEVLGGPLEVPSALEVHSELGGDPRRLLAVMLEQLLSCLPMKQDAPLAHQISIKHVLIERVRKTISRGQSTIGQLFFLARFNQPGDLVQSIKLLLQIQFIHAEQSGKNCRSKLLAFNAGVLKRAPICFGEGLDLLTDHAAHAFRHLQIHFRNGAH